MVGTEALAAATIFPPGCRGMEGQMKSAYFPHLDWTGGAGPMWGEGVWALGVWDQEMDDGVLSPDVRKIKGLL